MTRETIKSMIEQAQSAMQNAFAKMLESSSEEDIKKYENLCAQMEKLNAQLKEAEANEERDTLFSEKKTPVALAEKEKNTLDEKVQFVKALREAVAKGSTFTGLIPRDVAHTIQEKKAKIAKLRGYCTVHQATGDYTVYVEGDDVSVAYVGEGSAITETTPSIKPIGLSALKLGALIKVSSEYIEDLAVDVLGYLTDKIAKGFAEKEDTEILFGAGTTSSKTAMRGIDTGSIETVTAASATAFTWNEVKKTIQALKAYRENAILVMNSTTLDAIHEFKDGSNYIFDQNTEIKSIMGCPVVISDKMPTAAAGKTVIIAGDFSYYHIMDRDGLTVKTLYELYAANDQVGITAIERIDGDFVADAFAKLVMKSA